MTRRALLIGSQTFGLVGVAGDVAAMAAALGRRGFGDIRRREGTAATRDGIVAAYEGLIADTTAGDVALVYYAGHGQYLHPVRGEADSFAQANRQFIVPFDYDDKPGADFRGITALELSVLLSQLTKKTRNAVVVLDCCHSSLMSRDRGEMRIRQLRRGIRHSLDAHLKQRIAAGLRIDLLDPVSNRHAVRLVACARGQYAYEGPSETGSDYSGVFTSSLIAALDEAEGARVTWSMLIGRVRQLVQAREPHQRPEAEGPSDRLLFETESDDAPGSLRVTAGKDGRVCLPGAPLLGVQLGDEFAIMPPTAAGPAASDRIATVQIDRCSASEASGKPVFAGPGAALPVHARAFWTLAVAPRIAARVPDAIAAKVQASTFVRVAEPGEPAPLEVTIDADGAMTLRDRFGPLHAARRPGPETAWEVVADLNRCARAITLRTIREESGWAIDSPVTVEWGLVRAGRPDPLPVSGAAVSLGDAVYIKVRNDSQDYIRLSLVDIGVAYGITLLTSDTPAGSVIGPGGEYVYGYDYRYDRVAGVSPTWPEGLDPGLARPETVLAFLTNEPQDMSVLTQPGVLNVDRKGMLLKGSPLTRVLAHLSAGVRRELGPMASFFSVRSIEFDLLP